VASARRNVPVVLALDVGTSSCRAGLYDAGGDRVPGSTARHTYRPETTANGGAVLDADTLFDHVCQAIDAVAAKAGDYEGVAAVAPTTFWHSLMGVDPKGRAVTPVYLWMDSRSRDAARALKQELDEAAIHARTGCMLHWTYWPAKLRWLKRTEPRLFDRVHRWISFGEYLALRVFGEAAESISMASGTGLLDQHTCEWDKDLLDALSVQREQLSPLIPLEKPFAEMRDEFVSRWPTLRRVPWIAAVGDGATSNVGAGCLSRERFALMVGTSGAMRALFQAERFTIPKGLWCYRLDGQRIVLGGALNDGGSLAGWMRRTLKIPALQEVQDDVDSLPPDGHGLTVLPFWGGERSPGWASGARGAIVGLSLHTRPAEILRAALEAIALRFGLLDEILREAVPEGKEVIATGGALYHSPAWVQIIADVLGRPVLASPEPEASSRGVALLALETLGLLPEPLDRLRPTVDRVHEPVPSHNRAYRAAAERQRRLYDLLVAQT
jgi:gluconokinase